MTRPVDVARWLPWLPIPSGSVSPADSARILRTPGAAGAPWLDSRVYLALGADLSQPPTSWSWVDVTNYVRFASGITQTVGRPDESSTVQTSSGSLVFDNTDGRFSRKNPLGPYYGLLSRNTPIWGTIDAGTGAKTRLAMFVNEWPSRWDPSQADATVPIKCAGIMRRLAQGTDPGSPLRRTILAVTSGPRLLAYWPMEGGLGSGLLSGTPLTTTGTVNTSATVKPVGSTGAFDFTAGGIAQGSTGRSGVAATTVEIEMVVAFSALPSVGALLPVIARFEMPNAGSSMVACGIALAEIGDGFFHFGFWRQLANGSTNTGFDSGPNTTISLNTPYHLLLSMVQIGADVWATLTLNGANPNTSVVSSTTLVTPTTFTANPTTTRPSPPSSMSHVAVWSPARAVTPANYSAAAGWVGETAVARIVRSCAEDGVPLVCTGATAPSPAMGPQPVGTLLGITADAEAVDQGVLYETLWGLGYQTLFERTDEPVGMALDIATGQLAAPPEPADDDQRLRNRWRANRTNGGEVTKELTTGQLGTGPGGPGLYDDAVTPNVQADTQLGDQAGWRLHRDTIDEDRYPSLAIALHNIPTFIDTWTGLPWGARVTVAHPPGQMAPDNIDAIIEGYTETWDQIFWTADLKTAPFATYRTGTLAADVGDVSEFLLILTPDTLTLAAAVDTTATSWSVNSSPLWTTNSEMFPRRIMWEGEEIRLTNCVGASAPQTWTVVRSVNGIVKAHSAGSAGRLINPGVLSLA